jgi:hypothetical protein
MGASTSVPPPSVEQLVEMEEAAMKVTNCSSFDVLQYSGGGSNGAVFLVRCRDGVGNPFWRCVECARGVACVMPYRSCLFYHIGGCGAGQGVVSG